MLVRCVFQAADGVGWLPIAAMVLHEKPPGQQQTIAPSAVHMEYPSKLEDGLDEVDKIHKGDPKASVRCRESNKGTVSNRSTKATPPNIKSAIATPRSKTLMKTANSQSASHKKGASSPLIRASTANESLMKQKAITKAVPAVSEHNDDVNNSAACRILPSVAEGEWDKCPREKGGIVKACDSVSNEKQAVLQGSEVAPEVLGNVVEGDVKNEHSQRKLDPYQETAKPVTSDDVKNADGDDVITESYNMLEQEITERLAKEIVEAILSFKAMHGYWEKLGDSSLQEKSLDKSSGSVKDGAREKMVDLTAKLASVSAVSELVSATEKQTNTQKANPKDTNFELEFATEEKTQNENLLHKDDNNLTSDCKKAKELDLIVEEDQKSEEMVSSEKVQDRAACDAQKLRTLQLQMVASEAKIVESELELVSSGFVKVKKEELAAINIPSVVTSVSEGKIRSLQEVTSDIKVKKMAVDDTSAKQIVAPVSEKDKELEPAENEMFTLERKGEEEFKLSAKGMCASEVKKDQESESAGKGTTTSVTENAQAKSAGKGTTTSVTENAQAEGAGKGTTTSVTENAQAEGAGKGTTASVTENDQAESAGKGTTTSVTENDQAESAGKETTTSVTENAQGWESTQKENEASECGKVKEVKRELELDGKKVESYLAETDIDLKSKLLGGKVETSEFARINSDLKSLPIGKTKEMILETFADEHSDGEELWNIAMNIDASQQQTPVDAMSGSDADIFSPFQVVESAEAGATVNENVVKADNMEQENGEKICNEEEHQG